MGRDFLPRSDAELAAWSANFSGRLNESPETYGVPPERAAAYAVLSDDFLEHYRAAAAPITRTGPAVASKNEVRARLKREARLLSLYIKSQADVTEAQRLSLGLSVPSGG